MICHIFHTPTLVLYLRYNKDEMKVAYKLVPEEESLSSHDLRRQPRVLGGFNEIE